MTDFDKINNSRIDITDYIYNGDFCLSNHLNDDKDRFLPQLEKTHETFPSLRDEARFPCIVSRAIAFSQSNM